MIFRLLCNGMTFKLCCFALLVSSSSCKNLEGSGQIPQVTFARKAAIGSTVRCFGLSCSDGAALVTAARDEDIDPIGDSGKVSKYQDTRILCDTTKHLFKVDKSISVALTGIPSDCRHILKLLRKEAQDYRSNFGESIPAIVLSDKVAAHLHDLTMSPDTRPLAVTVLIGSRTHTQNASGDTSEEYGGEIVKLTCDGSYDFYFCCSTDSKYSEEETFLTEKLTQTHWSTLSVEDAVAALGAILRTVEAPEEDDDDANDSEGGGRGETEGEVTKPRRMRKHPYTIVETVKVTE